jgi:hypothetical protein
MAIVSNRLSIVAYTDLLDKVLGKVFEAILVTKSPSYEEPGRITIFIAFCVR